MDPTPSVRELRTKTLINLLDVITNGIDELIPILENDELPPYDQQLVLCKMYSNFGSALGEYLAFNDADIPAAKTAFDAFLLHAQQYETLDEKVRSRAVAPAEAIICGEEPIEGMGDMVEPLLVGNNPLAILQAYKLMVAGYEKGLAPSVKLYPETKSRFNALYNSLTSNSEDLSAQVDAYIRFVGGLLRHINASDMRITQTLFPCAIKNAIDKMLYPDFMNDKDYDDTVASARHDKNRLKLVGMLGVLSAYIQTKDGLSR